MSHLLATNKIILNNIAVLLVWYGTAAMEWNSSLQYIVVFLAGVLFIWGPYFFLTYCKEKNRRLYALILKRCLRRSPALNGFYNFINHLIDDTRAPSMSHSIK